MTSPPPGKTVKRRAPGAGRAAVRISQNLAGMMQARREPEDAVSPALLEYQWPSTTIVNAPVPRVARNMTWIIMSMVVSLVALMGFLPIDQVVTARGIVVSKAPTILMQPFDTAIVRSIDVREGEFVRAGQVLVHFNPTFAAADLAALKTQVASFKAEVARLQAQAQSRIYSAAADNPASQMQASIYVHDQAEFNLKSENYKQKIGELSNAVARADADVEAFRGRLAAAAEIEKMRKELEAQEFGSHLNTLLATDTRLELSRSLADAQQSAQGARRDLAAMQAERDAFIQGWSADIGQKLSDATRKLSDASAQLNKANLHSDLVELRSDRDAIVQSIAKVSVGSVVQSGESMVTLVPANALLEIEANVSGRDDGFVHLGDPVAIKFDTFPFSQYGMALGTVRMLSPDSFTAEEAERNPTGSAPVSSTAEPFYRARIAVERAAMHNVPRGFRVIPGMPVTADIKVGKRTVLGYLLGRVMPYAQEGMREP